MSAHHVDCAALVAAAVREAIREKAPRRTVAAVAAAVAGVCLQAAGVRSAAQAHVHVPNVDGFGPAEACPRGDARDDANEPSELLA